MSTNSPTRVRPPAPPAAGETHQLTRAEGKALGQALLSLLQPGAAGGAPPAKDEGKAQGQALLRMLQSDARAIGANGPEQPVAAVPPARARAHSKHVDEALAAVSAVGGAVAYVPPANSRSIEYVYDADRTSRDAAEALGRAPHVLLTTSWKYAGLGLVYGKLEACDAGDAVRCINREFGEETGVPSVAGAPPIFSKGDCVFVDRGTAFFVRRVFRLAELKDLQQHAARADSETLGVNVVPIAYERVGAHVRDGVERWPRYMAAGTFRGKLGDETCGEFPRRQSITARTLCAACTRVCVCARVGGAVEYT